ncbi:MAG: contact-dependent growth inhibition system immunity protein [Jatrophihabitantaceae bacterium]
MTGQHDLTIDQLDGPVWGDPPDDATDLIREVYRLRQVPLDSLVPSDLRLLTGQDVACPVTVPRALSMLQHNPLIKATYYEGDLLVSLLTRSVGFWASHRRLLRDLAKCVGQAERTPNNIQQDLATFHNEVPRQLTD